GRSGQVQPAAALPSGCRDDSRARVPDPCLCPCASSCKGLLHETSAKSTSHAAPAGAAFMSMNEAVTIRQPAGIGSTGMISTASPGKIAKCGWPSNIRAAASCDSARTTVKAPISLLMSAIPPEPTRLVLPSGPPMSASEVWCFATHAFQAAMPSFSLAFRSASDSALHAAHFALFLLPTKTARYVSLIVCLPDWGEWSVLATLQCVEAGRRLLNIRRKIGHLLHLANFDDLVVRSGALPGPFDRLLFRLHLDHPVAADHLLGLGERPVGHDGLAAGEGDARTHRRRVQPVERHQYARLLQRLIVFHHRRHGLRRRHRAGRCRLIALRDHQHHESHVVSPFEVCSGGARGRHSSTRRTGFCGTDILGGIIRDGIALKARAQSSIA